MKKLRVGVIYGGRSGEHEVSLASAAAVLGHLDRSTYDAVPIHIERDGRWTIAETPPLSSSAAEVIQQARLEHAHDAHPLREVHMPARPSEDTIVTIERSAERMTAINEDRARVTGLGLDVVFPVLHGPYGEDGTVQGLLELANVPYVGSGVLASAVGMDKAVAKLVFAARGLPIGNYVVVARRRWLDEPDAVIADVLGRLALPVFVKPANLGSSVGITKAVDVASLEDGLRVASGFDRKILVEAAIPDAREIEVAVIGNDEPEASMPGEILPSRDFYDYDAKYLAPSQEIIPAPITPEQTDEVRRLAIEAFRAVDAAGFGRVDFLLSRTNGALYLNEINTIPGFTTISMFAKLWAASGVEYPVLLDRLIALARERHAEKQQLRTTV
ncbi:MAG: D-alanine--D-alanine ligase [Luteitalea sp.]|nr:D-alanine--D-alanine ligase [Luteitalea sp.]